jgi:protein-S-isoprenylcysteine O-methyltransferase Ste14
MMDAVRYYLALITLMSLVPAIVLWYLIHPFGSFWRALPSWLSCGLLGAATLGLMLPVFLLRRRLLYVDFGTNWVTILLAAVALFLGGWVAVKRKRYLNYRILAGWPQLSARAYPGTLLTQGIYGKIRHPRYVEVALWVLAYALIANFLALYIAFLLTLPGLLLIVVLEERELEERFGEEWRAYAARTPRFIPRRAS